MSSSSADWNLAGAIGAERVHDGLDVTGSREA